METNRIKNPFPYWFIKELVLLTLSQKHYKIFINHINVGSPADCFIQITCGYMLINSRCHIWESMTFLYKAVAYHFSQYLKNLWVDFHCCTQGLAWMVDQWRASNQVLYFGRLHQMHLLKPALVDHRYQLQVNLEIWEKLGSWGQILWTCNTEASQLQHLSRLLWDSLLIHMISFWLWSPLKYHTHLCVLALLQNVD